MNTKEKILEDLRNLEILINDIKQYIKSSEWIYTHVINKYINQINNIINKLKGENVEGFLEEPEFKFEEWEYSTSGKTIRDTGIERLNSRLTKYLELIKFNRDKIKSPKIKIKEHEMRRCFKLGISGCPQKPNLDKNKIFVGMPAKPKYKDSYNYGIKIALESYGYEPYLAIEEMNNIDIMCKICFHIQESYATIFNLSGFSPNVMLELGIAYGIGKKAIILSDNETPEITNLKGIEIIKYSNAYDLQQSLPKYLDNI